MIPDHNIVYKLASTPKESLAIARLNYHTFVEEIPQHAPNENGMLVDRFDLENTYIIAKKEDTLIGMIALRARRPFSLDEKIPNLERYLPRCKNICEIRLLAIEKEYRNSPVFYNLAKKMLETCIVKGYDYCVISATTRQLKLYSHLGFTPFHNLVGKPGALYQPMFLSIESLKQSVYSLFSSHPGGD